MRDKWTALSGPLSLITRGQDRASCRTWSFINPPRDIPVSTFGHALEDIRERVPPRALRGGISKSIFQRLCQYLAINAHEMAPRTGRWLQERGRDTPTQGFAWTNRSTNSPTFEIRAFLISSGKTDRQELSVQVMTGSDMK